MSSEFAIYKCAKCRHEPFDSKAKLSKHESDYHREIATFNFRGEVYALVNGKNNSYVCPNCKAERSSISGIR
ncbi:hypothetical protein V1517DRAFT_334893, partial [Lipomyces orientalis]